eukprot:gene6293-7826_t
MCKDTEEFIEQMDQADVVFMELGLPTIKKTLFTPGIDLCLARVWYSRGSFPSALQGYSLGEYTVGILSQVFNMKDGLWLVLQRALLLQETMHHYNNSTHISSYIFRAQIGIVDAEVKKLNFGNEIFVSNYNMANYLVVTGTDRGMKALTKVLGSKVSYKKLNSKVILHSPFAKNISEKFKGFIDKVKLSQSVIPIISTCGDTVSSAATSLSLPAYWSAQFTSS